MFVICERDCWDGTRYFTRGFQYEIAVDSPCIIHFRALPGASPEDVQALTQAQRAEIARGKKELEAKRAAKPEEEDFTDFKLPITEGE